MHNVKYKRKQINAILSDYDGTLCPTTAISGNISNGIGKIPQGLEQILFRLSDQIPICIISSKDFASLHNRVRFAKVLSCVIGLETIDHYPHYNDTENNLSCVGYKHLSVSSHSLLNNSKLLHNIVKILQTQNYEDIIIEEKYTSNREILIGLTIGYRHIDDWQSFKENKEPVLRETIQKNINESIETNPSSKIKPFIQVYSNHPFLDVYGVECDKGLALDSVLSHLEGKIGGVNIMYLGDSENDNPAFRKSNISIGIRSDTRLNPKLDCKYKINFNQLPLFLSNLIDSDFVFSEDLLSVQVE